VFPEGRALPLGAAGATIGASPTPLEENDMLGDHIRALKDGRWQHGIDLGDQRVLFLVETPGLAPGDRLRRVYRPEFTAGSSKVELVVHREPAYPAKAVVARAWSRFMDPSVVAMFRDSEAFAAWCKIGRLPEAPVIEGTPAPAARPAEKRPIASAGAPPAATPKPARATPPKPVKGPAERVARKPAAKKASGGKPTRKTAPKKASARKPTRKTAPKKAPAGKPTRKTAPRLAPRKAPAKKKGRR
jgi:hypothetical protein